LSSAGESAEQVTYYESYYSGYCHKNYAGHAGFPKEQLHGHDLCVLSKNYQINSNCYQGRDDFLVHGDASSTELEFEKPMKQQLTGNRDAVGSGGCKGDNFSSGPGQSHCTAIGRIPVNYYEKSNQALIAGD